MKEPDLRESAFSRYRLIARLIPAAAIIGAVAVLVLAAAAWAEGTTSTTSVVISTKTLPKLGQVLVNSKGYTLYMFVPDKQKKVTCVGGCALAWPPVKLPTGAKAVATGTAKGTLLGSDPDSAGFRVVTYNHWPLYTWRGDTKPGEATGQGVNANGGLWYVLSPAGAVIKTKATAPATTTKPSANSDGCPKGETIAQVSPIGDNDADNSPGGTDDHDGCL